MKIGDFRSNATGYELFTTQGIKVYDHEDREEFLKELNRVRLEKTKLPKKPRKPRKVSCKYCKHVSSISCIQPLEGRCPDYIKNFSRVY